MNAMRAATAVLSFVLVARLAGAGVDEALAALDRGDLEAARAEFAKLADGGDQKAMITMALFYHQGRGVPQDYAKAMDWYLKAFPLSNGDAYNNLGVLYRDGLGVPADRRIAYGLFLITHMRGLGDEATQMRAGRNLDREAAEQSPDQIRSALCLTEEYVRAYVTSRGKASPSDQAVAPSPARPRLKDKDWWRETERAGLKFECPKI